jgi:hypothetical protein
MEVLMSLVGREEVALMPESERKRLCHLIDAEILRNEDIMDSLLSAIREARSTTD